MLSHWVTGSSHEQNSMESTESLDDTKFVLRSWSSQSSLADTQQVPSHDSFDEELNAGVLSLGGQGLSFKDYVQERNEPLKMGNPVIPAAMLAGFTGRPHACPFLQDPFSPVTWQGCPSHPRLFAPYRKWSDPAVAIPSGASDRQNMPVYHPMDWR